MGLCQTHNEQHPRRAVLSLEKRLAALEAAAADDTGGYLEIGPVMSPDEWLQAAREQQAALVRERLTSMAWPE
jgi:hypothetical protein